jgi:hypothetical protein
LRRTLRHELGPVVAAQKPRGAARAHQRDNTCAPGKELYKHFGITAEAVAKAALDKLNASEPRRTSID